MSVYNLLAMRAGDRVGRCRSLAIAVGFRATFLGLMVATGCDGTARSGANTADAGQVVVSPRAPPGPPAGRTASAWERSSGASPSIARRPRSTWPWRVTGPSSSRDPDLSTADLQGISPDGQLLWTWNVSTVVPGDSVVQLSSPIAAPTGAIYFGQLDVLTALSATGQPLFATQVPTTVSKVGDMAPAVASDGTAYFQYLTSIGPDGTLLWSQPTGYLGTVGNANTVVLRSDWILSVGGSQANSERLPADDDREPRRQRFGRVRLPAQQFTSHRRDNLADHSRAQPGNAGPLTGAHSTAGTEARASRRWWWTRRSAWCGSSRPTWRSSSRGRW